MGSAIEPSLHPTRTSTRGTTLPAGWLAVLLGTVYLLAGQWGHDPWKHEDAIHIGVAWQMAHAGQWLTPQLAGQPWLEQPPLWYWCAALLGQLFSSWLPFHDGARLASASFGALFLAALAGGARELWGRAAAPVAPLLAIGSLGLLVPLHEAQPASATLAGLAIFYWGLLTPRPRQGAALLAIGLGIGLMSGGLAFLVVSLPLLPLMRAPSLLSLFALLAILPLIALWPLSSPAAADHFAAWWQAELVRMSALPQAPSLDHLQLLAWAAWPSWPLVAWLLWVDRRERATPLLPLAALLLALLPFALREARPLAVLPLLPILALLATGGLLRLRRGAASALDWFGIMSYSFFLALVWLGGLALHLGWPPKIARNFDRLAPGHVAELAPAALLVASLLTILWLTLFGLPRTPWRPALRWAAGITVLWGSMMMLWLPWIDHGKSYRSVVVALRAQLPAEPGCLAGRNLSLAMSASLDYFAGLHTRHDARGCLWLLQAGNAHSEPAIHGWTLIWQGHRPGDRNERLRLYRRADGSEGNAEQSGEREEAAGAPQATTLAYR